MSKELYWKGKTGKFVDKNGTIGYLVDGLYHNENGPAIIFKDGTTVYYLDGQPYNKPHWEHELALRAIKTNPNAYKDYIKKQKELKKASADIDNEVSLEQPQAEEITISPTKEKKERIKRERKPRTPKAGPEMEAKPKRERKSKVEKVKKSKERTTTKKSTTKKSTTKKSIKESNSKTKVKTEKAAPTKTKATKEEKKRSLNLNNKL